MILKELLAYRTHCLVHKEEMHPYMPSDRKERVGLNERGLSLYSHSPWDIYGTPSYTGLTFHWDGTYNRNSACPKWVTDNTLVIYMICDKCKEQPIYKSRSLGMTTLMDVTTTQHYYTFILLGDGEGNYDGNLDSEKIKYVNNEKFYHVDADLRTHEAQLRVGSSKGSVKLEDMLNGYRNFHAPHIDMRKVTDLDKLIDKIKIYNLFS
jgi:hypothetical protein